MWLERTLQIQTKSVTTIHQLASLLLMSHKEIMCMPNSQKHTYIYGRVETTKGHPTFPVGNLINIHQLEPLKTLICTL